MWANIEQLKMNDMEDTGVSQVAVEPRLVLPQMIMTAKEYRQAKLLMSSRDKCHFLVSTDFVTASERQIEYERAKQKSSKIDALVAEVLARELGIERYMVVRVRNCFRGVQAVTDVEEVISAVTDVQEVILQVLNFDIKNSYLSPHTFSLHGRRVKKNGTLGKVPEGVTMRIGWVSRRRLDGTWMNLSARREALPCT